MLPAGAALAALSLRFWRVGSLRAAGSRLGFNPVSRGSIENAEVEGPGGFMKVFYANHPAVGINGRGVNAFTVLRGSQGADEWLVEFTEIRQGNWMFSQTAFVSRVPGEDLPLLFLREKTALDAGRAWPFPEVPGAPEGAAFRSSTADHPVIARLLGLLTARRTEGWVIEGGYEWLIFYRPRRFVSGGALESFVAEARQLASSLRG